MANFLLKIVILFFFLLTSVSSEIVKKFEISGNKRISDETIIIFSDIAIKLGTISRHYQTDYSCKLLVVEKSTSNFKKLFKLSKIKSKQRILEFCKELLK